MRAGAQLCVVCSPGALRPCARVIPRNPAQVLDKCFENVCELDLIFHSDKVHYILDEIVMGGMVLETGIADIMEAVTAMQDLESKTRGALIKA